VVVASCTPLTHAPLFQDSIREAGLNPYLFEMANIRNQCSWVHSNDQEAATRKAKDLVRMAAARAALLEPQTTLELPVERAAMVIGGGAAGMTAALFLAEQGFPVHLVEKEASLGGNLQRVFTTAPPLSSKEQPKDPQDVLQQLLAQVWAHSNITIHLNSQVVSAKGFRGNFTSVIKGNDSAKTEIKHGAIVIATGAQEYRGPEYGYGHHPGVLTQMEFEALLTGRSSAHQLDTHQSSDQLPDSIVMIQCVGPADQFCSRICCTVALKNALAFKQRKPHGRVVILYKDIRVYGFKERLYTRARQEGVIFVRYDDAHAPHLEAGEDDQTRLTITAWDLNLGQPIQLNPDLLVLSMPVVPANDVKELAALFKVPVDADGFFSEAHVKLRPVDFATDGIFMAGMAHYPKLLDETMIQAQAAASRAARVLSRETLTAGGRVAVVDELMCTGCLTCVRICPFNVPQIQSNLTGVGNIMGAAYIEPSVCQGCGLCAAECPARAIQLMHYTDAQMTAKVSALLDSNTGFVPLEELTVSDNLASRSQ